MTIQCEVCKVNISTGLPKQRLYHVRRHFSESSSHQAKVIALAGREKALSESVAHIDQREAGQIEFLRRVAPGTFKVEEVTVYAICNYYAGNGRRINLHPEHGSFENNVLSHLRSKQHTVSAKGKKQSTLDHMYGRAKPNPEPVNE